MITLNRSVILSIWLALPALPHWKMKLSSLLNMILNMIKSLLSFASPGNWTGLEEWTPAHYRLWSDESRMLHAKKNYCKGLKAFTTCNHDENVCKPCKCPHQMIEANISQNQTHPSICPSYILALLFSRLQNLTTRQNIWTETFVEFGQEELKEWERH